MILPTFTYCEILLITLTNTQQTKLDSFHRRAVNVVSKSGPKVKLQSVSNANKKRACTFVRACLDNECISDFNDYFKLCSHNHNTRNNAKLIKLPMVKTEYSRKAVYFSGAKLYNDLPLETRAIDNKNEFKALLKTHFS